MATSTLPVICACTKTTQPFRDQAIFRLLAPIAFCRPQDADSKPSTFPICQRVSHRLMNEGWQNDDYLILFTEDESLATMKAVSRRRTHLPNSSIKGDGVRVFMI